MMQELFIRFCSRSDHALAAADNNPPAKGIAPLATFNMPRAAMPPFVPCGNWGTPSIFSSSLIGFKSAANGYLSTLNVRFLSRSFSLTIFAFRKFGGLLDGLLHLRFRLLSYSARERVEIFH